jgi:DNA polymerase II small subunit
LKSIRSPHWDILNSSKSWTAKASDYTDDYTVGNPVGQSNTKGTLNDIVNLFYDRYQTIAEILRNQAGFKASGTIKQIQKEKKKGRSYNLVGIVLDVRRTKSGGKMVTMEDLSSTMSVFVRKDDPASATIFKDEVLGISGKFGDDGRMFWVDNVVYPDILPNHQNKGGMEFDPVSIAFISDLHMGSKKFLESEWDKMVAWMNTDDETAQNIKWLVLSGDVIDGIGIYPGHEENICIANSFDQYEMCARKLDELPDHITPILLPGNHDAVRPAEPQPMLEPGVQQKFNSTIHVGNPARINLSGIDVLSYHGKGIDDIVPRVETVTYDKPQEAMKLMLQKRHLAPMWGERNALSPEEEDQMVIQSPPDIFVTGHTHAHATEWHRGIPLVVSSTFQGETDFMQMMGYKPKMGYLSVYNIQNRQFRVGQFADNP